MLDETAYRDEDEDGDDDDERRRRLITRVLVSRSFKPSSILMRLMNDVDGEQNFLLCLGKILNILVNLLFIFYSFNLNFADFAKIYQILLFLKKNF